MDRYQRGGRPPGQRTHQAEGRQFGPAQHPFPLRPVLTDVVPGAPLLACVTAVATIRQMLAFSLLTSLRCMREGRHVPLSLTPPLSTPQCLLYSAEGSMPSGWEPFGIRSRCVLGLFVGACRVCVYVCGNKQFTIYPALIVVGTHTHVYAMPWVSVHIMLRFGLFWLPV